LGRPYLARDFAAVLCAYRRVLPAITVAIAGHLGGCASLVNSAASGLADSLSAAIVEQEDPALVREATPAYLLLLDSMVLNSPEDAAILGAAAQLYAAYGTAFVADADRARTLTARARGYGARALCAADKSACRLDGRVFDEYEAVILAVRPAAAEALYSYSVGSLAFIRAHSGDWAALADLPKIEVALKHLLALEPAEQTGNIYLYLGILNSLRPPALGGNPESGKEYFERAMQLTEGRDLSVKVEYARGYARLVYDRELHDRLLNEVVESEVKEPGLTLYNSLAQEQARELLASADEYF
jgi:hypothetical protein